MCRIFFFVYCLIGLKAFAITPEERLGTYVKFIEACQTGDIEVVRDCISNGVDVSQETKESFAPILYAAIYGHLDVVKLLVKNGVDTQTTKRRYGQNWGLLQCAIFSGNHELVAYLVKRGIPNYQKYNKTADMPEYFALIMDDPISMDELVQSGYDPTALTYRRCQLLTLAAYHQSEKVVAYLLEHGFEPKNRPDAASEALLAAAQVNDTAILKQLLEAGANPNIIKETPPYYRKTFSRLEHFGAQPTTPLVWAVMYHNTEAVNLLLQHKADPAIQDNAGAKLADLLGNEEIYHLLIHAGAPSPAPYAYLDWVNQETSIQKKSDPSSTSSILHLPILPDVTLQEKVLPSTGIPYHLAVIPGNSAAVDLEPLVIEAVSKDSDCQIVERTQIKFLTREKTLQQSFSDKQLYALQTGQLLPVDALLFIDTLPNGTQALLVSVHTGLILDHVLYSEKTDTTQMLENLCSRIMAQKERISATNSDLTLVSIPLFIAQSPDATNLQMARRIKQELTFHLSRLPSINVLDREHMTHLANESSLKKETRDFFASGWLIDGSCTISDIETGPVIHLSIRTWQNGSTDSHRIKIEGSASDFSKLLSKTVTQLQNVWEMEATTFPQTSEDEAITYLISAQRAQAIKLWGPAYQNAAAAWAMGSRNETLLKVWINSIFQLMKETNSTRAKLLSSANPQGFERLVYQFAPIHISQENQDLLSGEEMLSLCHQLLDQYEFIFNKEDGFTESEQGLLGGIPDVILYQKMLMDYYPSLSDQRVYGAELNGLKERIRRLLDRTLKATAPMENGTLYTLVTVANIHMLHYLTHDQETFYNRLHETFQDFEARTYPYNKYDIYKPAFSLAKQYGNETVPYPLSKWYAALDEMAGSPLPNEAVIGRSILRKSSHGAKTRFWTIKFKESVAQAYSQDSENLNGRYEKLKGFPKTLSPESLTFQKDTSSYSWHGQFPLVDLPKELKNMAKLLTTWTPPLTLTGKNDPVKQLNPSYAQTYAYWENLEITAKKKYGKWVGMDMWTEHTRVATAAEARKAIQDMEEIKAKMMLLEEAHATYPGLSALYQKSEINNRKLYFKVYFGDFETPTIDYTFTSFIPYYTSANITHGYSHDIPNIHPSREGFWVVKDQAILKLNEEGQVTERYIIPSAKHEEFRTYLDEITRLEDCSNSEYLLASFYNQDYQKNQSPLYAGVYHKDEKKWERIYYPELKNPPSPESKNNKIQSLVLAGDWIVYSFTLGYNHAESSNKFNRGISMFNIKTKAHKVLSLSTRLPPESPFDGDLTPCDLYKIDKDRICIPKKVFDTKSQKWVDSLRTYQISTQTWSIWDGEHPFTYPKHQRYRALILDRRKIAFNHQYAQKWGMKAPKFFISYPPELSEEKPSFILNYAFTDWPTHRPKIYPENWVQTGENGQQKPLLRFDEHEKGIVGFNPYGFVLLSKKNLREILAHRFDEIEAPYIEKSSKNP